MTTVRDALVEHYGDDFAKAIDHIAEIVDTYRTDYEPTLVFSTRYVAANDVHGYVDYVSVANYRVLSEDWCDYDIQTRTYSNVDTIGIRLDAEAPADLVDVINALSDYPALSDDAVSQAEQDMVVEHWESYGRSDLHHSVAAAIGADTLTDYAANILEQLVFSGVLEYGCGGYPSVIDVSAVDFGTDEITKWVKSRLNRRSVSLPSRWVSGDDFVIRFSRADWVELDA